MAKIQMKAPKGTNSMNCEGHEYDIPATGIITVSNESHVDTLKRHGFVEHFEDPEEYEIDEMSKEELITFCEERGGDAEGLNKKQLKALARELLEA